MTSGRGIGNWGSGYLYEVHLPSESLEPFDGGASYGVKRSLVKVCAAEVLELCGVTEHVVNDSKY